MPVKRTDPPVSEAQRRLMEGVAHNREFAKKVGIPQSVGQEFMGDSLHSYMDAVRRGDAAGMKTQTSVWDIQRRALNKG